MRPTHKHLGKLYGLIVLPHLRFSDKRTSLKSSKMMDELNDTRDQNANYGGHMKSEIPEHRSSYICQNKMVTQYVF